MTDKTDVVEWLRRGSRAIYAAVEEVAAKDISAGMVLAADELTRLRAELERERLRLAACGVVAMSDTPESAAKNRDMQDDFKSASCDDVARRVDECMELRATVARLEAERAELRKGIDAVSNLIADSSGVVGLHLNGDVATWGELREGGRFEGWLIDFDTAMRGDREDG